MMKWLSILVLGILMGVSWMYFAKKGKEVRALQEEIAQNEAIWEQEVLAEKTTAAESLDNEKTFSGILLTFVTAGFVGIFFVVYVLPFFAHRVTHAVYDSAEMVEKDVMHDARSLLAQGEYEGAIASFTQAATADPMNRLPWVEIAKIYRDNLGNTPAAIQTLRNALESQAWQVDDAAYFMFRLAELYPEVEGHHSTSIAIMQQVAEQFPNTRHSANATHKLQELSVLAETERAAAEEREYLERMQRQNGGQGPA